MTLFQGVQFCLLCAYIGKDSFTHIARLAILSDDTFHLSHTIRHCVLGHVALSEDSNQPFPLLSWESYHFAVWIAKSLRWLVYE